MLHIFGKRPISIQSCHEQFKQLFPDPAVKVLVFSDVVYSHCMGEESQVYLCLVKLNAFLNKKFQYKRGLAWPLSHLVVNQPSKCKQLTTCAFCTIDHACICCMFSDNFLSKKLASYILFL